ncbi:MAG: transcription termination factor Rho [Pleomorphochaeta sp.]
MAEEVKQDAEKDLASEGKKSVKVVVKKRVKKTTAKKPLENDTDNEKSEEKETVTPKKTTRKRKTTKIVAKKDDATDQLELELDTPEPAQKIEKKKVVKNVDDNEVKESSNKETVETKKPVAKKPTRKKTKKPIETKDNTENETKSVEKEVSASKNSLTEDNQPVKSEDSKPSSNSNEEKPQKDNSQNSRRNSNNNNRNNTRRTNNNNNNNSNNRNNRSKNNKKYHEDRIEEVNLDENPDVDKLMVNDLYYMSFDILREKGIELGLNKENIYDYKRQEIVTEVLRSHCAKGGALIVEGTLEVLPDGYGFLRSSRNSYISGPEDIYVSANIIRHNSLKTGDLVLGQVKTPRDSERFYGLHKVLKINDDDVIKAKTRPSFDSLTPRFPDERMRLENSSEDVSTRLIDMFCPIGKGQRSLIVAPPRTGKTVLMQKIANAISENYPEIVLMVLLVDERPEEVTDMKDNVRGEVIASTFDEQATRHVQVAEMAIEKAKRMVEAGKDVVILLDSITRLARAYNQTVPASGKILSGGVDSNALHKPKRFFGAARNMEGGGSLTIVATALIETGSRMDEVIFEEFKGTGNNEIVLDRRLSDRRIFPAINLKKSGTRRDDLLIPNDEAARIWIIRNAINDMDEVDQTPFLIDKMLKAKNNESFFKSINTAIAK